jgi:hypothetical protein
MPSSSISANVFGYVVGAVALFQIAVRPRFHLPSARATALRQSLQQTRQTFVLVKRRNYAPDLIWLYDQCLIGLVVQSSTCYVTIRCIHLI